MRWRCHALGATGFFIDAWGIQSLEAIGKPSTGVLPVLVPPMPLPIRAEGLGCGSNIYLVAGGMGRSWAIYPWVIWSQGRLGRLHGSVVPNTQQLNGLHSRRTPDNSSPLQWEPLLYGVAPTKRPALGLPGTRQKGLENRFVVLPAAYPGKEP